MPPGGFTFLTLELARLTRRPWPWPSQPLWPLPVLRVGAPPLPALLCCHACDNLGQLLDRPAQPAVFVSPAISVTFAMGPAPGLSALRILFGVVPRSSFSIW